MTREKKKRSYYFNRRKVITTTTTYSFVDFCILAYFNFHQIANQQQQQ
jgi:hypothetical protein